MIYIHQTVEALYQSGVKKICLRGDKAETRKTFDQQSL